MLLNLILLVSYIILFVFAVLQETTFAMVFSLIMVFLVACFLVISLGFEFLGYLILIVYVGAIAVLFLFMVMLFDRAEYKIFNLTKKDVFNYKIVLLAFLSSVLVIFVIFITIALPFDITDLNFFLLNRFFRNEETLDYDYSKRFFIDAHIPNVISEYIAITDIELLGLKLYSDYFVSLLLAGLGLLVAMIGCIVLTRSSLLLKRSRKNQFIEDQLNRYKL